MAKQARAGCALLFMYSTAVVKLIYSHSLHDEQLEKPMRRRGASMATLLMYYLITKKIKSFFAHLHSVCKIIIIIMH